MQILKYSIYNKTTLVRRHTVRDKVSIIHRSIAASVPLFAAGEMSRGTLAILNKIKVEPVWRWLLLPSCACVYIRIMMKTLTADNHHPHSSGSLQRAKHRWCVIACHDWSPHFNHQTEHCQPDLVQGVTRKITSLEWESGVLRYGMAMIRTDNDSDGFC